MLHKYMMPFIVASLFVICATVSIAADRKVVDDERKATVKTNATTQQTKVKDAAVPIEADNAETFLHEQPTPEQQVDMAVRDVMAGEDINWQVITGGGSVEGTSTHFRLSGAVGQTAAGSGVSTNFTLTSGFWQNFSAISNECAMAGDANHDGAVNMGDIVYIINYIFRGGLPPQYMNEADANVDCIVNLGDAIYIINYGFRFGPEPACGCVYNK